MLEFVFAVVALFAGAAATPSPEPRVVVTGACQCPAPADVQAQLALLARGSAPEQAPQEQRQALLTCSAEGTVDVVLRHADGARIADRALVAEGSCGDLASAIAVIIEAWEADLDPRVSTAVSLPTSSTPIVRAPAAVTPRSPSPEGAPGLANGGSGRAAARPSSRLDLSAAIGLLGAVTGSQISPGLTALGEVFPAGSRLGLGLALTGTLPRDASVGSLSNVARWYRITLALGPELRANVGRARLDFQLAAVAAALHVEGVGLPSTSSDTTIQRGAAFNLRGTLPGATGLWVGLGVLVFPGEDNLIINNFADQGRLPVFEGQVASGISFGRFR